MKIYLGNKYEVVKPIKIYKRGNPIMIKLEKGEVIHIGWHRDRKFGVQLSRDGFQEHWRVYENELNETTVIRASGYPQYSVRSVHTKEGGIMMKTYEEQLQHEAQKRLDLINKIQTEYVRVESTEAVKAIIDGKRMSYLGKLQGAAEIELLHVQLEGEEFDPPLFPYRFNIYNEAGRFMEEDSVLTRMLSREWYRRILTDRETLLELGYDDEQVAKMKDEDVQAEMEKLAVGGME